MYTHIALRSIEKPIYLLIFVVVYYTQDYIFKRIYTRSILQSERLNEANNLRKKYKRYRSYMNGIAYAVFMFYSMNLLVWCSFWGWSELTTFRSLTILLMTCSLSIKIGSQLPVYSESINPNSDYVLYLRSFSSDNYKRSNVHLLLSSSKFSEMNFIYFLEKYLASYALAAPNTLVSPLGATRLYTANDKWKNAILNHMKLCKLIVFHVDDSPSCNWEFDNLTPYLDKIVLISEDKNKLINLLKKMSHPIISPDECKFDKVFFYYSAEDEKFSQIPYTNRFGGYKKAIEKLMIRKNILKKTRDSRKSIVFISILILSYLVICIPAIMSFSDISIPIWLPFILLGSLLVILICCKKIMEII